jgi:hypothetical protein
MGRIFFLGPNRECNLKVLSSKEFSPRKMGEELDLLIKESVHHLVSE